MEPLSSRAVMIITFVSVTTLIIVLGVLLLGRDAQVEQRLGDLSDPQSALLRRFQLVPAFAVRLAPPALAG